MKQGWEIKKLEAVTKRIFAGGDKPKNFSETITDTLKIPVYANGVCDNGLCGYTDTSIVTDNCITVSARGTIGFCCIRKEPFVPIVRLIVIIPNDNIVVKYLYYAIKHSKIDNSGTSIPQLTVPMIRNISIPVPPLAEQERIVEILDREFERIDALKANAEQNLQHAKDLFQAALKQELQPKEGWEPKTIRELSEELFAGGDVPKHALSKTITTEYNVPIYANAVEQDGLYGYTNVARVNKPSITIAGRGSGTGYIIERTEKYLPVVRLIVIVPQTQIVRNRFLYYALKSLDIKSNGSAIPQLTVPMIAQYIVNYPTLTAQDVIIGVLDELNERCKALEENYKKTIALCDDMKQSLLRKAFNGEL